MARDAFLGPWEVSVRVRLRRRVEVLLFWIRDLESRLSLREFDVERGRMVFICKADACVLEIILVVFIRHPENTVVRYL